MVVKRIASTIKQCERLRLLIENIEKYREADEALRLKRSHLSTTELIVPENSTTTATIIEVSTLIG